MTVTYWAMCLLVLYGDLVKRLMSPLAALGTLYACSIAVILFIFTARRFTSGRQDRSNEGALTQVILTLLIVVYTLQFIFTSHDQLLESSSHWLYMVIPLALSLAILSRWWSFDVASLGRPFMWLIIPINVVGVIQYSFDPTFLLSTVYSGDAGGIIERNLLYGGSFKRFPALFASADRYSAMALFQVCLSWALLAANARPQRKQYLWFAFNLACGVTGLVIAGARSRILIAGTAIALVVLATVISGRQGKANELVKIKLVAWSGSVTTVLLIVVAIALYFSPDLVEEYPVLSFLTQSAREGDIESRLLDAIEVSMIPDDVTLFGDGLGTIDNAGKPGEFGMRSVWIESGLFWGFPILLGLLAMSGILLVCTVKALIRGDTVSLILCAVAFLSYLAGLLAGLTASFELSSGLMLGCITVSAVRSGSGVRRSGDGGRVSVGKLTRVRWMPPRILEAGRT